MKREDILSVASMPAIGPSYPRGPYRFVNREYLIISYKTDPAALRAALPEPLEPLAEPIVNYEWMRMPDSSGFGDYTETGCVIPCRYNGQDYNFTVQMYLDDEAPIVGGREIWGFPKKYAHPKLELSKDTLVGSLHYSGQLVATGTMGYKHENCANHLDQVHQALTKPVVNLKLIPDIDGGVAIAQLVTFRMTEVTVKGAWAGPARLHLIPHVNAPVADLPVVSIVGGRHFLADLTLPYGEVLVDYLVKEKTRDVALV